MLPLLAPRRIVAAAIAVALLAGAASALAAGALAQVEPTELPPTPTPSPADIDLAHSFARDGRVDEAIGAYLAVIAEGEPDDRLTARFAVARRYIDSGRAAEAIEHLDAYLLEAPAATDLRGVQYLLAEALAIEERWGEALALYDAYIASGGGASLYARVGRVEALIASGRTGEALPEAQALLERELPQQVRLALIFSVAAALEQGTGSGAVVWYEMLEQESASPADKALAHWRRAVVLDDLGDPTALVDAARLIIQRYPQTATALEIVHNLPNGLEAVDGFQLGLIYYQNGVDERARQLFEDLARGTPVNPNAARASFYLGVITERAGETDAAIGHYARAVALDPRSELADDALWWEARLLEARGDIDEASERYRALADGYGATAFGREARFRLAVLDYDAGDPAQAARGFQSIAGGATGDDRARALLWEGKALAANDDVAGAQRAWQRAVEESPEGYHGLRAAVLLGRGDGELDGGAVEPLPTGWAAIEAWLDGITPDDPSSAFEPFLYNRHWGLGQELLGLGMQRRADAEFNLMLQDAGQDATQLYQLARFFHSAGLTHLSSRAATRLLDAVPDADAARAPADLWRLAYPAPYAALLEDATEDTDVPSLVMLAMIRQESFFDPLAGSSAGALGLTQVIPATGEAIAGEREVAGFDTEHLYRPALSLEFGAHYLDQQLDTFDGDLYRALAAYNAGPDAVARWDKRSGGDIDRFVAEIEFAQTRAYIELVLENLARYRWLYEGLDAPALPNE